MESRDFFDAGFRALTGHAPMSWQRRLFEDHFLPSADGKCDLPSALDIPTGLGKTSVMTIWWLARKAGARLPRRLVYVVDRRAVVDQATEVANRLKEHESTLRVSTLRGKYVDNREWLEDPTAPAIIVGTVDMIGSRLLFSGYGVSPKMRPYHAGLLGADTLLVLDEAHLVPPFEALLRTIARDPDSKLGPSSPEDRERLPRLHLMSLSATGRTEKEADASIIFRLSDDDHKDKTIQLRLGAAKQLALVKEANALVDEIARRAWTVATARSPARVLVYCNSRQAAMDVRKEIVEKQAKKAKIEPQIELLVGERRVHEREKLFGWLVLNGFADKPKSGGRIEDGVGSANDAKHWPEVPAFLVATSAGEVGVDLDADHMVCDLVEWERMVQRLGRVNRRGGEGRVATIQVVAAPPKAEKKDGEKWSDRLERLRKPIDALNGDASPGAIVDLKERAKKDPQLEEALDKATTRPPLRPALTRALVDAWSMTSLDEHTGRPDIQPWLRGWEDGEPQATLALRRWLPWRKRAEKPIKKDVEDFFDSAPVHLEETLEAPTYRILDWLGARATEVLKASEKAKQVGETAALTESSPALIVLDRKGKMEDALLLKELAEFGERKGSDRKRIESDLTGRTLVVSAALGGLTENGMLDDSWRNPTSTLDDGWKEEVLYERIGYRILGPGEPDPDATLWKLEATIPLTRPDDTESGETDALRVYVARGRKAARAGDQAITRNPQSLTDHQEMVAEVVGCFAEALGLPDPYRKMLNLVALHHDLGKKRDFWQDAMAAPREGRPYAKTIGRGRRWLNGYRHEFGSLVDVEKSGLITELNKLDDGLLDLALHLVASHHGYARPNILAFDPEAAPPSVLKDRARDVALRFARLQKRWGPWGLAWWEALLRAADQQASRENDAQAEEGEEKRGVEEMA